MPDFSVYTIIKYSPAASSPDDAGTETDVQIISRHLFSIDGFCPGSFRR
jgi:hypothetical protein